jgi:diaminopimelate decarboxylase
MHGFRYCDGTLFCEEMPVEKIARQVGTPCYIYSARTLADNFRRLDAAFAKLEHLVCYAVKANSNLGVLHLLAGLGSGFDIVSGGELYRVLRAGGRAARCTFAGVGKSRSEITMALREGVYCINVESEAELDRIEVIAKEMGVKAPVAVRVNPDVDAGTHEFISTGKSKNKFGIGLDRAADVYARAAACPHLLIKGIQTHIGSQILDPTPFAEAVRKLVPLVTELHARHALEFFSIGGGLGIVYAQALESGAAGWWESESETPRVQVEDYAAALVPLLKPLGLRILLEPGRFLAGNAGALVTSVEYIKETPAKRFAIVDAGMNDLIRPALYDGWHQIVPIHQAPASAELATYDVVGPVCESGDFFAKDRELPRVAAGDLLAVLSAGAYGSVMASNYNTRPLAPEVLVDAARFTVVRKRQTYADLLAGECTADEGTGQ